MSVDKQKPLRGVQEIGEEGAERGKREEGGE